VARLEQDLELILARWVLRALPPEDVPALATEALVRGCEAASVAVVAGLSRPTRSEIEDELPEILRELDVTLPSKREALKTHVDPVARDIVNGSLTPPAGANEIFVTYLDYADQRLWDQFVVLYSLADEYREENRPASVLDQETVAAARALLAAGGLRVNLD
jgi:hypothetical protein